MRGDRFAAVVGFLVFLAIPLSSRALDSAAVSKTSNAAVSNQGSCLSDAFKLRVDRALAGYIDVASIPGVSVGIVAAGSLIHTASAGFANKAQGRKASSDTLYNVASVTKLFTATLTLMLVEDGVIALDAPVATYLPDMVHVPTDADGGKVTIRHLLSHTAGLPKDPPNRKNLDTHQAIDPGIWDTYSVDELYAALSATTLKSKVGEKYEYSNYGYALLGHVAERMGGAHYESLLRKRLLAPLGMSNSAITLSAQQSQQLAAFYWSDDPDRKEQPVHARFGEVAGFIGLTSSVKDLSLFVAAQLQRGADTSDPISLSVRQLMATPRSVVFADPTVRVEIGHGWFRETRLDDGTSILYHTGEVDGHTSGLYLDVAQDVGVVVLQNLGGDTGTMGIQQIGMWLLAASAKELRSANRCALASTPSVGR